MSIRMNSAYKKTEDGHINRYRTNLERQIDKGDRGLVCRNEQLCKEVKMLLHNGNSQKIHHLHGLDSLAVMEKSLNAFPSKTGQMGLEKLSNAFEVLELAALNLYVYPWRREYRLVKMFSGVFTYSIKPALTLQQVKELFGLLGYQASSPNEEEELALNSELVPTDFLLGFACGFFTARMECQLLLSALDSVDRDVEWVLQLVKERQAGHSLQVALENTKKKRDAANVLDAILTAGIDTELDLYTEQTDASQVTSASCSPPYSSYMQPKVLLHKEVSQSNSGNNEDARQEGPLKSPGLMESFAEGDAQRQAAAKVICSCTKQGFLYIYQCETCKGVHSSVCDYYKECGKKGHNLALCQFNTEDLYSAQNQLIMTKERSKDSLKTHFCMMNSSSESFVACNDCQLIHEHNCKERRCNHYMQSTGTVQPPRGERVSVRKRNKCLSSAHNMQYPQETGDSETPNAPIPYHRDCLKANQTFPDIVCFTCEVFHFIGCPDLPHCSQKHKIHHVRTHCIKCLSSELSTLCRYCGAVYCRPCCYKNTFLCKCGKPFSSSSI
ncbi:spermatogenesis-associated protein 2-like protein isoform X1 [Carassius auratus]|uniref:Spermatogenesis-associated protein 2-like protein isoform X1 n=1 Tax=Carassius auratus TaxID=7957 RepID=A0A6P6P2B7_CARAU|nr:spermatogenesis-associated protein 2-like protein isoform X1 [Carassius auratus]